MLTGGLKLYYGHVISQNIVTNLKSRWEVFLVEKDFVDAVVKNNPIKNQDILCRFIVKFCKSVPNMNDIKNISSELMSTNTQNVLNFLTKNQNDTTRITQY